MKQFSCPTCNNTVSMGSDNRWRPFCSERCRLIDLGDWMNESNRIPQEEADEDFAGPENDQWQH